MLVVLLTGGILGAAGGAWAGVCDLISRQEAAQILGEDVKPGRESTVSGFAAGLSCKYFTAAPLAQRGGTGSVTLVVYDAPTMKAAQGMFTSPTKYFERMHQSLSKVKTNQISEVSGLGDKAFWQAGAERLHILHGDVYYILSIKDLVKMSSDKGMADLQAKLAAHRRKLCIEAARKYLLP